MNVRLVALPRRSNHSGSISYVRVTARSELCDAVTNPPLAPPRQFKNSCQNHASQNASVTPLASALTQVRIVQDLKPSRINTYAKTGGGSVLLLYTLPKRQHNSVLAPSLHLYFIASLHQPRGIPFVATRTSHERLARWHGKSRHPRSGKGWRYGWGKFDGAECGEFVEAGGRAG